MNFQQTLDSCPCLKLELFSFFFFSCLVHGNQAYMKLFESDVFKCCTFTRKSLLDYLQRNKVVDPILIS